MWLRDVCLVWERVPDLIVYFSHFQINLEKGDTTQYTPAEISLQIHRRWEHRKQGLALRVINKPKATRSAFATDVMFDGENAPEDAAKTATTVPTSTTGEKPDDSKKRRLSKNSKKKTANGGAALIISLINTSPRAGLAAVRLNMAAASL